MKRLTLLVARDEDGRAVVVGAWEQSILEIIDQDEVDKVFRRAKNEWYPDGTEWREITLLVDEDHLLAAFDSPPVHGSGGAVTPPADRMGECVPGKEALDALDRLIDYAGWATTPKSHRDAVATVRSSLSALREENERLREERDEERQSRIEYMDIARAERGAAQAAEAEVQRLTEGLRGHAYDGIEHTQPGPFADCLLCRLETIESAARAYIEHAYPSLLRGVRDPNHPLLSALAKAIPPDGGGAK